ncbi:MAG: MurNAc-LAA protein-like protein [Microviridae sp.]|nr:MAG: MurNAc-LAA protein-like protein [Microviridae sp.]
MFKVFISPSNQSANTYSGIDITEADNCRAIALHLSHCLSTAGFNVLLPQPGESMAHAVKRSNEFDPDLHICIHTNAYNGRVFGTRLFTFGSSGVAFDCAKVIFDGLCKLIPDGSNAMKQRPGLYELKNTVAPAVYVEVDFHDVPDRAKWLVENRDLIAHNIATSICKYFSVSCPVATTFNCPYCGHVLEVK